MAKVSGPYPPVFEPFSRLLTIDDDARALVKDRESGIAVIDEHQGRAIDRLVVYPVVDVQRFLAQDRRDFPGEFQVGSEDDGFPDLSAHFDDIVVSVPLAVGMDLPGGKEGKAPVETEFFVFFFRIDFRMSGERHPAAQDQPAVEPPHPTVSLGFVERRAHVARVAAEAERHALVVG